MNVHEVGNSQALGIIRPQRPQDMGVPQEALMEKVAAQPAPERSGDEGVPGVVRLLQEGHFKGVANVRLNINFYDELQQVSRNAGLAVMESGVRELTAGLQGTVDKALEGLADDLRPDPATVEGLVSGFTGAAEDLLDAVRQGKMGFDAALAALGEELDALADGLAGEAPALKAVTLQDTLDGTTTITPSPATQGATGPADAENPEGTLPVANAAVGEATPGGEELSLEEAGDITPGDAYTLEDAVAKLKAGFADLLSGLKTEVSGQLHEPVFEAPANRGSAFAKFLEIYSRLGAEPQANPEAEATVAALDAQV